MRNQQSRFFLHVGNNESPGKGRLFDRKGIDRIMKTRKITLIGFFIVIGYLTAGCTAPASIFRPASQNAAVISEFTLWFFGLSAVLFVLVEGFLLFTYFRFRKKKDDNGELPTQIEGDHRFEIGWTVIPFIILVVLFVISLGALQTITSPPSSVAQGEEVVEIRAIGHRWFWEFDYPNDGIVTADEMHIPMDVPVKLSLESVDIIHSFWVPELGGKTDTIPGRVNSMWILADKPGIFTGQCAEFCGLQHSLMRMLVIVESKEQYDAWLKLQQEPIPTDLSEVEEHGKSLVLEGSCKNCHTLDGTDAKGTSGPNLTHFASRQTFAGAILPTTEENVRDWITDPQALKPGNLMPKADLSEDQINQITAFLMILK
jgi:cytochrome c oxidase subunit 2